MTAPDQQARRAAHRGEAVLLAVVMAGLLVVAVWSFTLSRQAMLLPLLMTGVAIPGVLGRLYWLLSDRRHGEEGAPVAETGAGSLVRSGAWAVGLLAAVALVGFYVAVPLFVAVYLLSAGQRWWSALVAAVGSIGVCYLFERFLMIDMSIGLLL